MNINGLTDMPPCLSERMAVHAAFWDGAFRPLVIQPIPGEALYDLSDYRSCFNDPLLMYSAEEARARKVLSWPTDGIPSVRPNLGVVFIPAIAGQSFTVGDDHMPWPGTPLAEEAVMRCGQSAVAESAMMLRAKEFYRAHAKSDGSLAAYHPDTQGVFDIAHLLRGDELFLDIADGTRHDAVDAVLSACGELYRNTSVHIKQMLDEPMHSMVHAHGTSQGVYFPHAGVRMAEDTATLLSPPAIERFVLPAVERAAMPFGGVFAHFCGKHDYLFEALTRLSCVKAVDLGNPEMYDAHWLCATAARNDTALYTRLPVIDSESQNGYLQRIAGYAKDTGVRLILRSTAVPDTIDTARRLYDRWLSLFV